MPPERIRKNRYINPVSKKCRNVMIRPYTGKCVFIYILKREIIQQNIENTVTTVGDYP